MKTLFKLLIPAFLFVFFSSSAQEFSLETNSNEDYKLKIENINAKIAVNTHEGNELIIKAEGYTAPTAKAEGLNILRQNGLENTSIGLVVNEIDNNIIISGGNKTSEDLSYEFILPKNMSLSVVNTGFYLGLGMTTTGVYDRLIQYVPTSEADIVITDTDEADEIALEEEKKKPHLIIKNVSKEVEISYLRGSIMMENVTGPIVAKTDYGDIKISFSEVINQESPMSILCNNGDIDINFPANTKANFKLNAGFGEIYTDLDLKVEDWKEKEKKDLETGEQIKSYSGRSAGVRSVAMNYFFAGGSYNDLKATLNGGGVEITIRSQQGDLYLRKEK